jgi:hypothetical protein
VSSTALSIVIFVAAGQLRNSLHFFAHSRHIFYSACINCQAFNGALSVVPDTKGLMQMNTKIMVFVAGIALAGGVALADGQGGRPNFESLDTDGDGQLSEIELDSLPGRGAKTGADRLARLDTDSDGYVSQDELRQARQKMGSGQGGQHGGGQRFEKFDADGDGQLSRDEMSQIDGPRGAPPPEMFDRMDANDDGYVTQDEMQAMRQQRQGGKGHGGGGPGDEQDQGGPAN